MQKSDEEIEDQSKKLRQRLGIHSQARPDMMTIIVKLKQEFPGFDYKRVPDEKMPDDDAQFDSEARLLLLKESTFQAMQRGEPRARFTVAHEIGHFAMGHRGVRNRSLQRKAFEAARSDIMRDETEASRFASSFLAPKDLYSGELINTFGLSQKAAEIRKATLDRMARREHRQQRPLPPEVTKFLEDGMKRGLKPKTEFD